MSECAIRIRDVSKIYGIWRRPHHRLTGALARRSQELSWLPQWWHRVCHRYHRSVCREFHALRHISFEVPRGQTVGIVGRNGSGKSTTLKIIAGTLRPTSGQVEVRGRVAALLELGSGFNPEFTGRENVYLNAAILGLRRAQIDARLESILAFADIGEFVDQPVKTYSSGMMLRLAFAVQTAVEPEILIIDEALSVGDEGFRRKCFARLERLREQGTTILLVSHDLGSILNLTDHALFFNRGEIVLRGAPAQVVRGYEQYVHAKPGDEEAIVARLRARDEAGAEGPVARPSTAATDPRAEASGSPDTGTLEPVTEEGYDPRLESQSRHAYASHGARIHDFELLNAAGERVNRLLRGRRYRYRYRVTFERPGIEVSFAMLIKTFKGVELGGARSLPVNAYHPRIEAGETRLVEFAFDCLLTPGVYFLNAGVEGDLGDKRAYLHRVIDAAMFRVCHESDLRPTGLIDFRIEPLCLKLETAEVPT